jgi:hypothetical protein
LAGIKGEYIYDEDGNIIGATGSLKTAMTNKKNQGSDFYKKLGKLGGLAKVPKGFGTNRELAARAGRISGSRKRKSKAYNN